MSNAQLADMVNQLNDTLRGIVAAFVDFHIYLPVPEASAEAEIARWQARIWRAADQLEKSYRAVDDAWWRSIVLEVAARDWVSAASQYGLYQIEAMPWYARDFEWHMGRVRTWTDRWSTAGNQRCLDTD